MKGILIRFLLLVCTVIVYPGIAAAGSEQVSFTFLSVGNYDGQIKENIEAKQPGVSRFAAALKEQRKLADGQLFFVSTGNMLFGTPESELTEGMALISVFNDLRLDVMAVGTGDLKWPSELLPKQAAASRYAYVGLSPISTADDKLLNVPYKLIKRGGVRVGFLAVNKQDFAGGVLSPDNILTGSEKIQTYITELHNENADLIVMLTDIESVSTIKVLLNNLAGIDMIIADTPAGADGRIGSTVLISTGQGGRQLSRTDIVYDKATASITDIQTKQLVIELNAPTDTMYNAFLDRVDAKVSFLKQQEAGRTENELWHNLGGTSLLAQFAADTVREAVGADIALINGGEICGGLKKGTITKGDMYRIFPVENEVVTADISGRNLKQLLYDGLTSNVNGIIMFSGIRVCYDDNKQGLQKIAVTLPDGRALDNDKIYRVAMSQQVYKRYDYMLVQEAAEFSGRSWRSYVAAAMQDKVIAVVDDQRLVIIPYVGEYDFID